MMVLFIVIPLEVFACNLRMIKEGRRRDRLILLELRLCRCPVVGFVVVYWLFLLSFIGCFFSSSIRRFLSFIHCFSRRPLAGFLFIVFVVVHCFCSLFLSSSIHRICRRPLVVFVVNSLFLSSSIRRFRRRPFIFFVVVHSSFLSSSIHRFCRRPFIVLINNAHS